jgi:hypothetical protein
MEIQPATVINKTEAESIHRWASDFSRNGFDEWLEASGDVAIWKFNLQQ